MRNWWRRSKAFEAKDFVGFGDFGDGDDARTYSSVFGGTVDIIDFVFGFFVDNKDMFPFVSADKVAGLNFLLAGDRMSVW